MKRMARVRGTTRRQKRKKKMDGVGVSSRDSASTWVRQGQGRGKGGPSTSGGRVEWGHDGGRRTIRISDRKKKRKQ